MSVRLKLLLAFLVAGAVASFWYAFGTSFTDFLDAGTATIAAQSSALPACADADGDGLCNDDERYWNSDAMVSDTDGDGFLDGEEVLTGHSPVKPGPDDYLDEKRNLTERASTLLLGAVVSGALDRSNPGYEKAIGDLVDEIFEQYDANVAVERDSMALGSDTAEDLIAYGVTMNNILERMFAEIKTRYAAVLETAKEVPVSEMSKMKQQYPEAFRAFTAAAVAEADAFDARVNEIKSVRVPPSMKKFHTSLLLYARGMQQRYRTLGAIDRDPLSAFISLRVIDTLVWITPLDLMDSFEKTYAKALLAL